MAEHYQEYPVATMCRVLEVSVSGYYAWHKREPSLHSREDAELANKLKDAFQSNRGVYGSPRIHAELHAQGIPCARKRVARLMQELKLAAKRPRHPAGHDEKRGRSISSSEPAPTGLSCCSAKPEMDE
jgi:putative transposase